MKQSALFANARSRRTRQAYKTLAGLIALVAATAPGTAHADVKLYGLFASNMVLQREKQVPVWGTAAPGERVAVKVGGQTKNTVTAADGAWRVMLNAMSASATIPFTVTGNNEIALANVAVGDVYICAGQSNMQLSVGYATNGAQEIATANHPGIRYFEVPKQIAGAPQRTLTAPTGWAVCSPQTAAGFSATGYFFARELNQKLGVPIGLINATWNGTFARAWTSRDTLLKRDDLRAETLQAEQAFAEAGKSTVAEQTQRWWNLNDQGTRDHWDSPTTKDAAWRTVPLPSSWDHNEIGKFDGVAWFRRQIEIPPAWAGKDVVLHLGIIDDRDTTFFAGELAGSSDSPYEPRKYTIPGAKIKAGRTTIAVRVLDLSGDSGFMGGDDMRLELAADGAQKIALSGDWKYQLTTPLAQLPPMPQELFTVPNRPAVLFNGMIAPLIPFAVRGVVWYQGEADAENSAPYRTLFPALIRDWRSQWNAKQDGSEFGFYFVQLPNYMARVPDPVEEGWAEMREAQSMALKVPRTGMATAIDIGEARNIHPPNKQDVGKRLALVALATEYGQKIEFSGPIFLKVKALAAKRETRITFTHAQNLKTTDGAPPRGFALQDDIGRWFVAHARIEGEAVYLSNPSVLRAAAVRYAWTNNPDVNLVNGAGLPAVPFRTDQKPN